jgi:hypothetical protein
VLGRELGYAGSVMRSVLAILLLALTPALGCSRCSNDVGPVEASALASGASAAPAPPPPPPPATSASAQAAPAAERLQVLKLTFTSDVKNKEPVDTLEVGSPGQRVYAHLAMRNRTGAAKTMQLVFRVRGEKRSSIDLKVEPSWSFRTWAYNTLQAGDAGKELEVTVLDDDASVLTVAKLTIKGAPAPGGHGG